MHTRRNFLKQSVAASLGTATLYIGSTQAQKKPYSPHHTSPTGIASQQYT